MGTMDQEFFTGQIPFLLSTDVYCSLALPSVWCKMHTMYYMGRVWYNCKATMN